MTNRPHTLPALGRHTSADRTGFEPEPEQSHGPAQDAGRRKQSLECDEAEFVVCCFALCDWGTYSIDNGEVRIRGKA
jgi:hypothetical protein